MKTPKAMTDRQIINLMVKMRLEGEAQDTYRSGMQEAATAVGILDGGDTETKKRIARLLSAISMKLAKLL